jgi:hypothetical protein
MKARLKKSLEILFEEGKLKKSGGVEEAERIRKAKDDRIRREIWERQNERNKAAATAESATNAAPAPGDGEAPPE